MNEEKLITCPHCRSEIPLGANVCRGCQAEITYRTPKFFIIIGFLLPIFFGWYISRYSYEILGFNDLISKIFWVVITVMFWCIAYKICDYFFHERIHFERKKNT